MVEITGVFPHSRAQRAGIREGDILLEINGHQINDVLDYRFRLADEKICLKLHRGPEIVEAVIKKDTYDDIGLEFSTPLMDKKHRCENKCIFCFIDQNPPGMRETIYFKDDDSRLSFLHGNYITLTNLHDSDIDRIIEMRISPVNVSVHTTNPELRVMMMKNKRAGDVLSYLGRLADAGIVLRGQIVLCRGINDGKELDRTMKDLSSYYPQMDSVSVVPAGLTAHRENLFPLTLFTPEECRGIIDQIESFNSSFGHDMFFASDEFYITGDRPLPPGEYYGEYTQIENGVGLISSFRDEFEEELEDISGTDCISPRRISTATGEASYRFISGLVDELKSAFPQIDCQVHMIKNEFFGGGVTVSGLLTGKDIASQLRGKDLGEVLYLPRTVLRSEGDLFLCGMSPEQLEDEIGTKVEFIENDGHEFCLKIAGLDQ